MSSPVGFNITMENILIATRILLLCQVIIILAIWLRRRGTVTIKRVIDGDTIETSVGTVRLIGIDAPELGTPGAREATEALRKMVGGATVRMESDRADRDKYGRLLRYVWVGRQFVNRKMVRSGHAKSMKVRPNIKRIEEIE